MNIFVTSNCPTESARALDDKRVIKMVLESCQILNTTLITLGEAGIGYKPTHKNHPCVLWAGESYGNYHWLLAHFDALLNEYTERYGKIHKCSEHYESLNWQLFPQLAQTPFVNCTDFKHIADVHEAYKECLRTKWENDIRKPTWYRQDCNPNDWSDING
jgi:hypothetical protein